MSQASKARVNRIMWQYVILGFVIALTLVLLQEHVFNFWVFSEAGTVAGVMGATIGYAARAAYKAGWEDAYGEKGNHKAV